MRAQLDDMMRISTHAPAGGATYFLCCPVVLLIFLLTPLREGRPCPRSRRSLPCWEFLLTPLREGRQVVIQVHDVHKAISTHAPAGGATCISRMISGRRR